VNFASLPRASNILRPKEGFGGKEDSVVIASS